MKTILTALNSKFIHTNLAIRYLKAYCKNKYPDIDLVEFTINDETDYILGNLVTAKPDILGFSCYIWNIEHVLRLVKNIKKIMPDCIILLGGPEVSFESDRLMSLYPEIDYIVKGEGEETLLEFFDAVTDNGDISAVRGLYWRKTIGGDNEVIIYNGDRSRTLPLESVPFPYDDSFNGLENKIIYYEMSRGCPYNCQYCLSSVTKGVEFMPLDRIQKDVKTFIEAGVKQVKLVDRTFNCNVERAKQIFKMIMDLGGNTNFHFEMAGDLIDDETCEILSKAPPGLFQFEIGVQSTNESTLDSVKRRTNFEKLSKAVRRIISFGNIHIHLDLIAGLPYEDYESFGNSFNEVIRLCPDRLQLGFLKLLKGSGLRINADKYGYVYRDYPPYEVISNNYISYNDLWRLKGIEELLELYYNSQRYVKTMDYLTMCFDYNPFRVFEDMLDYWTEKDLFSVRHSYIKLYDIILDYAKTRPNIDQGVFEDVLLFDFVNFEKPTKYPEGLKGSQKELYERLRSFTHDESNINTYLPHMEGATNKEINRNIHIEVFNTDVLSPGFPKAEKPLKLLFDYSISKGNKKRTIHKVIP